MHGETEIKVQLGLVFFFTNVLGCTELSCIPVPAPQPAAGILLAIPKLTETGTQQLKLCVRKEEVTKPFADNDDFFLIYN